jgi:hypothetical protein
MQNKLLYLAKPLSALLFIFVVHGFTSSLYSQVALNDNRTKEILFTDQVETESQSRVVVSLANYSKILSPTLEIQQREWISGDENVPSAFYQYRQNGAGFALPGEIVIDGIDERVENAFSIQNVSSGNFGKLNISTDFVIQHENSSKEVSLVLRIRNSDGIWSDAGRGVFYPDAEQDEETFSVQITVSDVYLKQNDVLDLMWVNRTSGNDSQQIYTQRIEITPHFSDLFPFQAGDILITEFMPIGDVDGFEFEYIELFNPDDHAKSLKGVSIQTEGGSHTIQSDVQIPAYGYLLISNADFSDVQNVDNSYFYSGDRLFSNDDLNGRIEILQNGDLIASSLYESAEKNVAFETKRLSQSVSGYTGLQNLTRAVSTFMPDVYGSPGYHGSTLPVYHKTFANPGTYMIVLPGQTYNNLMRLQNATFYTLNGEPIQLSEIEPYQPLFLLKTSEQEITLSVEAVNTSETNSLRIFANDGYRFISPAIPGNYTLRELYDDENKPMQSVVGLWNPAGNSVEMEVSDEAITPLWQPIIERDENGEVSNSGSVQSNHFNTENSFSFTLFEVANDEEKMLDEVWVELNNENSARLLDETTSYFKKPVYRLSGEGRDRSASPTTILYGNFSGVSESGLSYFRLTPDNQSSTEFSLGLFRMGESEQKSGILKWNIPENIPEDWSIILTDRETGQTVDMQIENSYTFRMQPQSENIEADISARTPIQPVDIFNEDKERFTVRFEPPNLTLSEEENSETPGSIELRQNYPNPFNPSTNITFFLPEDRQVRLGIYNIVGQQVATLIDDNISAGEHSVVWNASNNPSGIYIVQLETGSRILTRKITLVK